MCIVRQKNSLSCLAQFLATMSSFTGIQAVVETTSQSTGNDQISTVVAPKPGNGFWWRTYNCVVVLTTLADPYGAATTLVVWTSTWLITCFDFLADICTLLRVETIFCPVQSHWIGWFLVSRQVPTGKRVSRPMLSPDWRCVLRQRAASQVYLLRLTPAQQADLTLLDEDDFNGHSLWRTNCNCNYNCLRPVNTGCVYRLYSRRVGERNAPVSRERTPLKSVQSWPNHLHVNAW